MIGQLDRIIDRSGFRRADTGVFPLGFVLPPDLFGHLPVDRASRTTGLQHSAQRLQGCAQIAQVESARWLVRFFSLTGWVESKGKVAAHVTSCSAVYTALLTVTATSRIC